MKKTFLFSLLTLTAFLMFAHVPTAEARGHRSTRVQVNVGNCYSCRDAYVMRSMRPAPMVYAQPMAYAQPIAYAQPVMVQPAPYYAPVYAYQPVVMEEVYVAPAPRTVGLGGLSFSWNFFR